MRLFKPCLKVSTVSMSINAVGKQFHWYMALGKNEYLYSFVIGHHAKFMSMFASSCDICRYQYFLVALREESSQTNVILHYKLLASILSAVCSVIQQS